MIDPVKKLTMRGMTQHEAFRLLLEREPTRAYWALAEVLKNQKSVSGTAEFFKVDASTIWRWCVAVSRATGKKDPRDFLSRRVAKTEFGKIVIEEPARAKEILNDLRKKHDTDVEIAEVLGVRSHTVRRWRKTLRIG